MPATDDRLAHNRYCRRKIVACGSKSSPSVASGTSVPRSPISKEGISGLAASTPDVEAVFTIAGDPDALVWIRIQNVAHLRRVIDQLRRSGRVTGTKTLMVLDTWRRES